MNEIENWISIGSSYVFIMKSGSQHGLIVSSASEDWVSGYAGVTKTACLFEYAEDCLKFIVGDIEAIKFVVGSKTRIVTKQCIVKGPEMMVRASEIAIIEKSGIPFLNEECFDSNGEPIEDAIVGRIPELERYWVPGDGFKHPEKFKIVEE